MNTQTNDIEAHYNQRHSHHTIVALQQVIPYTSDARPYSTHFPSPFECIETASPFHPLPMGLESAVSSSTWFGTERCARLEKLTELGIRIPNINSSTGKEVYGTATTSWLVQFITTASRCLTLWPDQNSRPYLKPCNQR